MLPALDSSEDAVRVCGPDEGFGIVIVLLDIAVDGGLKVDDGEKDAAFEAPFCECGEEGLDGVEPGGGGRREVEGPARMALEPNFDLGVLVGGVIVENCVNDFPGWNRALDSFRKRMNS